jgi:hypothetical protein
VQLYDEKGGALALDLFGEIKANAENAQTQVTPWCTSLDIPSAIYDLWLCVMASI